MKEKFLTTWWFIQRPRMYVQAWQLFIRRIFLRNDRFGNKEALTWCKKVSISENDALNKLFPKASFGDLFDTHADIIELASSKVKNTPVQMGGEGALNILYNITFLSSAKKILETGVAYGWSSLAFLLALKKEGKLYSIDMPYPKMKNEKFVGIVVPEELRANWKLYRYPDRIGVPKAIKETNTTFDIIHYDSDKSYSGRKWAYPILWKTVREGGFFISDDIQDNIAFKEFCEKLNKKPIIVESQNKYVGIIVK